MEKRARVAVPAAKSPMSYQQVGSEGDMSKQNSPVEESSHGLGSDLTPLKSGTQCEVDTSNEKRSLECNMIVLPAEFAKNAPHLERKHL